MGRSWFKSGWTTRLMLFVAGLAATCAIVPSAGAVLVHTGNGHVAGVMLRNHVSPKSLRGSFDKQSSKPTSGVVGTEGDVNYNGGPVLHATTPYLIFWDPSGNPIASGDKTLLERFFNDVAADSGKATNQYSVLSQYGDGTGSASYNQTWSSAHAINDTHAYPAPGQQCTENAGFIETACLFDSQIQTEVQNEISLHSLPTGLTGSAPIYFVVLPPDVNSCFADDMTCADSFFCAYHSSVLAGGNDTTYANISLIGAAQGTTNGSKGCQFDGNDLVQAPNSATAGDTVADVAISYMSHEDSETITDPLGNAWFSDTTGNEVGDNCAFSGPFDPADGENPDAWLPTLGGTADAGNLFDEVINTNPYYTQTEWSNGNDTCEAKPQPIAGFSASASTVSAGSPVSFNASASTEPGGSVSSFSWNFGDGATGSGITPSHVYSTDGTYTVTLTVTGDSGNTDTTSNTVTVHGVPTARVSATGSPIGGGTPGASAGPAPRTPARRSPRSAGTSATARSAPARGLAPVRQGRHLHGHADRHRRLGRNFERHDIGEGRAEQDHQDQGQEGQNGRNDQRDGQGGRTARSGLRASAPAGQDPDNQGQAQQGPAQKAQGPPLGDAAGQAETLARRSHQLGQDGHNQDQGLGRP